MRLLLDENIPAAAAKAFASGGHDVLWIRTDAPGMSDKDVLSQAMKEKRVLITFDKDFGELVFQSGLPASCGIILLRLPMSSAVEFASKAVNVLEGRTDWEGQFSVVEEDRIRMTPLPKVT